MAQVRRYLRHPSNIGIEYHIEDLVENDSEEHLTNISMGGLAFLTNHKIEANATVDILIPIVKPIYHFIGKVKWCKEVDAKYEIGVEFISQTDKFKTRMVEQVCEIESYKQEILQKNGRELSSEEAALEWIGKYGAKYPKLEEIQ